MTVKIYQNGSFHSLAGQKIYHGGTWVSLPAYANIWLNNKWNILKTTEHFNMYFAGYNDQKILVASDVNPETTFAWMNCAVVSGVIYATTNFVTFYPIEFGINNGITKVQGDYNGYVLWFIRDGKLYALNANFRSNTLNDYMRIGENSQWTDIRKGLNHLLGICNGQIYDITGKDFYSHEHQAVLLKNDSDWSFVEQIPFALNTLAVADQAGKLYEVNVDFSLKSEIPGWSYINGFQSHESTGEGDHDCVYYGIRNGMLYQVGTDGSFNQIAINLNQWTKIGFYFFINRNPGYYDEFYPLAICGGKLYYLSRNSAILLDSSGYYTDCIGYLAKNSSETKVGYAIRNNQMICISGTSTDVNYNVISSENHIVTKMWSFPYLSGAPGAYWLESND